MRFVLLIWTVLVSGFALKAQDTTMVEKQGVVHTLREKINRTSSSDSLQNKLQTDSLQTKTLRQVTTKQQTVKETIAKTDVVNDQSDSLQQLAGKPTQKLDSLHQSATGKIEKLGAPFENAATSVTEKVQEKQQGITQKLEKIENGVTEKIESQSQNLQEKVQQKTSGITDKALPVSTQSANLPGTDLNLGANTPNTPGLSNPDLSIPNTDLPSLNGNGLEPNLSGNPLNTDIKTPSLPETDQLEKIGEETKNLDKKLVGLEAYENDLDKVKNTQLPDAENVDTAIEEKAKQTEQLGAANAEMEKIKHQRSDYEAMVQKYRDKKTIQQEMLRKSQNIANHKIAEFAPAIEKAKAELFGRKKVNPLVRSFKEITARRTNEMKGKPFKDRLEPGFVFQVYNADKVAIDPSPQLGYRITGRLSAGMGGVYRVSVGKDNPQWVGAEGISGYRLFSEFVLLKGIFVHGQFEGLHLDRARHGVMNETFQPRVLSSYYGLGKRYNISRQIKGSVAALYRVAHKGEVRGMPAINFRMGFYFVKAKRKPLQLPVSRKQ